MLLTPNQSMKKMEPWDACHQAFVCNDFCDGWWLHEVKIKRNNFGLFEFTLDTKYSRIFEFSADFDLTNGQSLQGASNLALFLHFQFRISFIVFQFHPVYPRTLKLIYSHTYTNYMPYSSTWANSLVYDNFTLHIFSWWTKLLHPKFSLSIVYESVTIN
jgi:hypothetical protein